MVPRAAEGAGVATLEGDAGARYRSGVFGEMLDTSPAARRFYYERLAALSPSDRLAMMYSQSRMARRLAESSIQREHPNASPQEIRARLAVRMYGRETAERVLGKVPPDAR